MRRIVKWIATAALAASPWAVYAQSVLFDPSSLTNFGPPTSASSGMSSPTLSTQTSLTPGMDALAPTLGTGASTLPTIGTTMPTLGTPTLPAIGTPTNPTIGTPATTTIGTPLAPTIGTPTLPIIGTSTAPMLGTPTLPTIGLQPSPPIGSSTSTIGIGAIGSPTTTVGSTVGLPTQMSAGIPTVQSTLSSLSSGSLLVNPANSPSGGPASVTGFGTGSSGSITGPGAELLCLPEDVICDSVVKP